MIAARPMVKSPLARCAAAPLAGGRSTGDDMARRNNAPRVGVVMGSASDWEIMQQAVAQLVAFGVPHETKVLSAHRTPDDAIAYAENALANGLACIIAGAGGAAHLAGVLAAKTTLPVLGVPMPSKYLRGEDSLLSTVQMPKGVPVATFAIGEAGAANAGLFAVAMLARTDAKLAGKLVEFRAKQAAAVRATTLPPRAK
jgi:5-(carboxyamino)imidazole ribonucleotide mutase